MQVERSFHGVESFSVGSPRGQHRISVVVRVACPSHSDTLRMSCVACRMIIAHVCLSTWGEMRFLSRPGCAPAAVAACCLSDRRSPIGLAALPGVDEHLGGAATRPRTASQARRAAAVVFHKGSVRSRRPLPRTTNAHRRQVDVPESFNPVSSGHAQTRTNRQMQHGPVADAIARGGIRGVEHRLQRPRAEERGPDADPLS